VFTDADYRMLLPEASSTDSELALTELLSAQALVRDRIDAFVLRGGVAA
jgi:hypothetical protein